MPGESPAKPFLQSGKLLDLSDIPIIRSGRRQNIRLLSEYQGSVLKTIKKESIDGQAFIINRSKLYSISSLGYLIWAERELRQFLIQCRKWHNNPTGYPLPFAHYHGFIMTNEGLGLLTERIVDTDGGLAPTFHELIKENLIGLRHIDAFDEFLERCIREHVVIGDITLSNLVWTSSRSEKSECVCIDGFGEKGVIPVHTWSKRLNKTRILRKGRMLKAILSKSLGGA